MPSENEVFETLAAAFQRDTGYIAPGKDVPVAMASEEYENRRNHAWRMWNDAGKMLDRAKKQEAWEDGYTEGYENGVNHACLRLEALAENFSPYQLGLVQEALAEFRRRYYAR